MGPTLRGLCAAVLTRTKLVGVLLWNNPPTHVGIQGPLLLQHVDLKGISPLLSIPRSPPRRTGLNLFTLLTNRTFLRVLAISFGPGLGTLLLVNLSRVFRQTGLRMELTRGPATLWSL